MKTITTVLTLIFLSINLNAQTSDQNQWRGWHYFKGGDPFDGFRHVIWSYVDSYTLNEPSIALRYHEKDDDWVYLISGFEYIDDEETQVSIMFDKDDQEYASIEALSTSNQEVFFVPFVWDTTFEEKLKIHRTMYILVRANEERYKIEVDLRGIKEAFRHLEKQVDK